MILLTAPAGLAAIALVRTASLRRRIRTTGGTGVTARQQLAFWVGLTALFGAAGLAAGDLADTRPMTVNVLVFSLVALLGVPLLMLSLPQWWVRQRLARWRLYRVARLASTPWIAAPVAAVTIVATFLPWTVGRMPEGETGSFVLVLAWLAGSTFLWLPVCSPVPEHRIAAPVWRGGHLAVTAGITPLLPGAFLMSGGVPFLGVGTTDGADIAGVADQHMAGLLVHLVVLPLVWVAVAAVWSGVVRSELAGAAGWPPSSASGLPEPAPLWRRAVD